MSNNTLTIEREFNAPIGLVWKAWTDQNLLMKWSCPIDFSVVFAKTDLKINGEWKVEMHSPEGKRFIMGGKYKEIVEPSKLVMTQKWEENDLEPEQDTILTVMLEQVGDKTKMIFTHDGLVTPESRDSHHGGWSGAFDNMGNYFNSLKLGK